MHYKFLNVNPLGKFEEDCVCRAISGALDINYYEVQNKLELVGALFNCEKLCVCCYKFLLDNVFNLCRIEEFQGMPVKEFIRHCDKGTYIIRVDGHLTHCKDGICYDIFDCTNDIVDLVWKAPSVN